MMEAARTSETSVENYFTRQYIPEDNSELRFISIFNRSSDLISTQENALERDVLSARELLFL
jgi:hypothetical protein